LNFLIRSRFGSWKTYIPIILNEEDICQQIIFLFFHGTAEKPGKHLQFEAIEKVVDSVRKISPHKIAFVMFAPPPFVDKYYFQYSALLEELAPSTA
jgi:hypothetical protein